MTPKVRPLGGYASNPEYALTVHFEESDLELFDQLDFPVVVAHNGHNHFVPTKPLKQQQQVAHCMGLVYESGLLLKSYMSKVNFDFLSTEQSTSWHYIFNVLQNHLGDFRPLKCVPNNMYASPALAALSLPKVQPNLPPGLIDVNLREHVDALAQQYQNDATEKVIKALGETKCISIALAHTDEVVKGTLTIPVWAQDYADKHPELFAGAGVFVSQESPESQETQESQESLPEDPTEYSSIRDFRKPFPSTPTLRPGETIDTPPKTQAGVTAPTEKPKPRSRGRPRKHQEGREYTCVLCDLTFKRSNLLKDHELTQHGGGSFTCDKCPDKVFSSKRALDRHVKKHQGESRHRCSFEGCDFMDGNLHVVESHEKREHGDDDEDSAGKHQCDICKAWFQTAQRLRQHKQRVDCEKFVEMICPICEKRCRSMRMLSQHCVKEHRGQLDVTGLIKLRNARIEARRKGLPLPTGVNEDGTLQHESQSNVHSQTSDEVEGRVTTATVTTTGTATTVTATTTATTHRHRHHDCHRHYRHRYYCHHHHRWPYLPHQPYPQLLMKRWSFLEPLLISTTPYLTLICLPRKGTFLWGHLSCWTSRTSSHLMIH